jgi:hypothetical protein
MIGFGDFPDQVDLDLARQRVERQRSELSERRFREGNSRARENSRTGENPTAGSERRSQGGPTFIRIDQNFKGNVPSQARAVSDCDIFEKDKPSEGRKRGLSSPERAVGFGFVRAGDGKSNENDNRKENAKNR